MANIQLTLPVEHADELLGMIPQIQKQNMPLQAKEPNAITAPISMEQGPLPSVASAKPMVYGPDSPQAQEQAILGDIRQRSQPKTPWGELSGGQKFGRVMGDIGQAVGSAFAGRVMPYIPGTTQHKYMELGQDYGQLKNLQDLITTQTADIPQKQAQAAYLGAEALGIPSEIAQREAQARLTGAQADIYGQAAQSIQDPNVREAFNTLSNPNATVEQRRQAYGTISTSPIAMTPMMRGMMTGAGTMFREGEAGSRVGGHNIIQDPASPTGYSTVQYDHFGNPIGTLPVEPSSMGQLLLGPQGPQLMGMESQLAGQRAAATAAAQPFAVYDPQTMRLQGFIGKGQLASLTGAGPGGLGSYLQGGATPAPTSSMVGMGQMAATVQPQMASVMNEVQQLAQSIGPAVGRWNELMVNKGGTDFPEFAGLNTDLDLLASAIVRTHFGAKGGEEYQKKLSHMFSAAQSPEDLIDRIQHAGAWIQGYASAGGMGPKTAPKAAAPTGGPKAGDVEGGYRFKGGNPADQKNWEKVK